MGLKVPATLKVDEPEKHLATEHAPSRKTFGRLLQAVTGRRYLLRHGHGMGETQLFEDDSCAHYTKGSNSRSSRLSLHLSSPRVHWFSGLKRHHTMTNLDLLDYESQTCWWIWIADLACCLPLAKNGSYAVPEPVLVWNQWIARPPEFQQVIKVCDRECDKAEAGGGRRERDTESRVRTSSWNGTPLLYNFQIFSL